MMGFANDTCEAGNNVVFLVAKSHLVTEGT